MVFARSLDEYKKAAAARFPRGSRAAALCFAYVLGVADFVYNGLEGCGVVECEVGEDFAVDFDAGLVDEAHEL